MVFSDNLTPAVQSQIASVFLSSIPYLPLSPPLVPPLISFHRCLNLANIGNLSIQDWTFFLFNLYFTPVGNYLYPYHENIPLHLVLLFLHLCHAHLLCALRLCQPSEISLDCHISNINKIIVTSSDGLNSRQGCPEGISLDSCRGACREVAIKGQGLGVLWTYSA